MKCRIPERQKVLNPKARPHIRRQLGDCAELTLAEVFGFGNKRLAEIRADVQSMYDYYDSRYPDSAEYIRVLKELFANNKSDEAYPARPGSGEKVLVGREHDIVWLCYSYQLCRRGFGDGRIDIFRTELCKRIRYYNRTFDGDYESVIPVIENRLGQRGIRVESPDGK